MILRYLWFIIIIAVIYVVLKNIDTFLQKKIKSYNVLRNKSKRRKV
jgi:hypothetical protein